MGSMEMEPKRGRVWRTHAWWNLWWQSIWMVSAGEAEWKPLQFLIFSYMFRIFNKLKEYEPASSSISSVRFSCHCTIEALLVITQKTVYCTQYQLCYIVFHCLPEFCQLNSVWILYSQHKEGKYHDSCLWVVSTCRRMRMEVGGLKVESDFFELLV
jgi:hypothetical protein